MHLQPPPTAVSSLPATHEGRAAVGRRTDRLKKRLFWTVGGIALLALLVLTPPLINANRYRARIAQTISNSLGRPVHLDNVSLHLLPVPGLTLQNFVVSENPAFGAEPTIRANSVEATLRLSSLWHRPLEFSRIHFNEPSVNLVRNPDGRWNLGDVLLHASHVDTAPTAQRRSGPAPRFPYVEATGGRINVKVGAEKLPFSLTDADFALWLPSAQQWRMRLEAQPARTDTNITDPGRVRLEGELRRAPTADLVPVNFTGSWHDAPLGEATHMLAGEDLGWRGTLNLDATLRGTLGNAQLATKLTLGGLRRAEFFPARTLDLQVTCGSGFALHPVSLRALECSLPVDAAQPLTLHAAHLAWSSRHSDSVRVDGAEIPARWALLWAGLFSPRIASGPDPHSTLSLNLARGAEQAPLPMPVAAPSRRHLPRPQPVLPQPQSWRGSLSLVLPSASGATDTAAKSSSPLPLVWTVVPGAGPDGSSALRLAPTAVTTVSGKALTVSGTVSRAGYSVSVSGEASSAAILLPARYLPELGDGLDEVLPASATGQAPQQVQFTCTRGWREPQRCVDDSVSPASRASGSVAPR